ncbi:MAG: hypothetical protein AAGC55_20685, partial [Myxococcota bacterium]
MGSSAATAVALRRGALIAALVLGVALSVVSPARADDSCTARTDAGAPFAVCFDPGNRLFVSATTDGYGGGIFLRHALRSIDEPDLIWKLDHRFLDARVSGLSDRYTGAVYAGHFLRHARDGHIVLPLGTPKKIFLPFDIGASAQVGRVTGRLSESALSIDVV